MADEWGQSVIHCITQLVGLF